MPPHPPPWTISACSSLETEVSGEHAWAVLPLQLSRESSVAGAAAGPSQQVHTAMIDTARAALCLMSRARLGTRCARTGHA